MRRWLPRSCAMSESNKAYCSSSGSTSLSRSSSPMDLCNAEIVRHIDSKSGAAACGGSRGVGGHSGCVGGGGGSGPVVTVARRRVWDLVRLGCPDAWPSGERSSSVSGGCGCGCSGGVASPGVPSRISSNVRCLCGCLCDMVIRFPMEIWP